MRKRNKFIFATLGLLAFTLVACRKEIIQVFEVQTQQISQTNIQKELFKQDLEFISSAYSDLFGKAIPETELNSAIRCYAGTSDKSLITDRIIRSYLNNPNVNVPTAKQMRNDVDAFTKNTYSRFYHRDPSEMELYKVSKSIKDDLNMTPEIVYFSFLTSNEYKFK